MADHIRESTKNITKLIHSLNEQAVSTELKHQRLCDEKKKLMEKLHKLNIKKQQNEYRKNQIEMNCQKLQGAIRELKSNLDVLKDESTSSLANLVQKYCEAEALSENSVDYQTQLQKINSLIEKQINEYNTLNSLRAIAVKDIALLSKKKGSVREQYNECLKIIKQLKNKVDECRRSEEAMVRSVMYTN